MRFQERIYEDDEMQTNLLLNFYPDQVKTHIVKRKHHDTEKVFRGIEAPTAKTKAERNKLIDQIRQLTSFQTSAISMMETKGKNRSQFVQTRMDQASKNLKELDIDLYDSDFNIGRFLDTAAGD